MARVLTAATTIAVLSTLGLLAWIGGEMHYRNCLANVELRYPVAYRQVEGGNPLNPYLDIGPQPHFVFHERADRNEAIAGCSRWP